MADELSVQITPYGEGRQISASLPSATVYVSGTVNGVPTVWTNVSGNLWSAWAAWSTTETYDLDLTLIQSTGLVVHRQITVYLRYAPSIVSAAFLPNPTRAGRQTRLSVKVNQIIL